MEAKQRRREENRIVGEGMSSIRHNDDDDELRTNTRTLRGQSEIVAKARRQRKKALQKSQMNEHEALGLNGTDAPYIRMACH